MPVSYNKKSLRQQFFNEMVVQHGDKCMICSEHVRHLVIDHDHQTSMMRGLLCMKHNGGLGFFNHDPKLLRNAAKYLEENSFPDLPKKESKPKKIYVKGNLNRGAVVRTYGGYDKDKLKLKIHELLNDPLFKSDRSRAQEISKLFGLSFSASQSRISRTRKYA